MRMLRHLMILISLLFTFVAPESPGPRAILLEARNLAYDANYRNDQAGLRSAIAVLEPLAGTGSQAAYANYYLWFVYWALAASQVQEKNMAGALDSGKRGLEQARLGVAARDNDPEFHTALANALIVVGFLDRPQFKNVLAELMAVRRRALELGPDNPRVVMMDAGVIFNTPPDAGGSRERGLARWEEALALFEKESYATVIDPIAPRWGHALAYGWMAEVYLGMNPPRKENARGAAETALRMRPDFWYVREQVLPRVRD